MEKAIAKGDKEALVKVVKICQTRGMQGSKGGWKDFLMFHDRKFGSSLSDPGRRSLDDLAAFLRTFSKEEDKKFFRKAIKSHKNQKKVDLHMKSSGDEESSIQRLVRLTYNHPSFSKCYALPSHEEGWVLIKRGKSSEQVVSESMIAIDCEMVLCVDGTVAVVKVCVVNQDLEVLLDLCVHPGKAVADYKTDITGIRPQDLEKFTCSLTDVQRAMKKLLVGGTILVGHSLFNDLQALKIDYKRVIDTSFIFDCLDKPTSYMPSLNVLCKSVLGHHVREDGSPHVCLDDARAVMKLVKAKLEGGHDDPIVIPQNVIPEAEKVKLLLHNIPSSVPLQELDKIFPERCNVQIQSDLRRKGSKYSTYALLKSLEEANKVFEEIDGELQKDSYGLLQKKIVLKLTSGDIVCFFLRKMANENPSTDQPKKRTHESEPVSCKRVRNEDECKPGTTEHQMNCNTGCDHTKEIEMLKERLQEREKEIAHLNKIVAALARKHGL